MPKVIVLVLEGDAATATLAAAAAEGARDVRFTEVDLRVVQSDRVTGSATIKALDAAERLADYDGVMIFGGADSAASRAITSFAQQLAALEPANVFANTVFAFIPAGGTILECFTALGGILVSSPRGVEDGTARARAYGARVAKVAGWVRHALGHEHAEHEKHHHHH